MTSSPSPAVWRDLDQQALDDAYNQSKYAANLKQVTGRFATNSEATRAHLGRPRRLAWADAEAARLDLFIAARPLPPMNVPVHVFVHGGAWKADPARDYAFLAECFVAAGACFVALDFADIDMLDGDLMAMAAQIPEALAWIWRNAASFGGDPAQIHLSAHSSGAHLAGAAITTDWSARGLPADLVKSAVLVSGMYDLEAVSRSFRARYVRFDARTIEALSPQRHAARIGCPVTLVCGDLETPEFIRQSQDFAQALADGGKDYALLMAPGYNHFEVLETLATPYGVAGRAALGRIGLPASSAFTRYCR